MPYLPTPAKTPRKRRRTRSGASTPNPRTPKRALERVFRKAAESSRSRVATVKSVRRAVRTMVGSTGAVAKFSSGSKKKNMPGYKLAKTGVAINFEYSGTGTCDHLGVVGHATYILNSARLMGWMIVFKKLCEKIGDPVNELNQLMTLTEGDLFQVYYKLQSEDPLSNEAYAVGAGSATIRDLANWATDGSRPWNAENVIGDQTQFFELKYNPIVPAAGEFMRYSAQCIRLDCTTIQCLVDTTLKIQNRTVAAVGDDEVDVNNVPLDGKVYSGNGTGPQWKKNASAITFFCDSTSGLIRQDPASSMYSPPMPAEFDKTLKKFGSVSISPGDIRTSHLNDYTSTSFDNWMAGVKCTGNGVTYFVRKHYGKYRFFVLERMIDVTQETPTPIVLVYENNVKYIVNAKTRVQNPTLQLSYEQKTGQDF